MYRITFCLKCRRKKQGKKHINFRESMEEKKENIFIFSFPTTTPVTGTGTVVGELQHTVLTLERTL